MVERVLLLALLKRGRFLKMKTSDHLRTCECSREYVGSAACLPIALPRLISAPIALVGIFVSYKAYIEKQREVATDTPPPPRVCRPNSPHGNRVLWPPWLKAVVARPSCRGEGGWLGCCTLRCPCLSHWGWLKTTDSEGAWKTRRKLFNYLTKKLFVRGGIGRSANIGRVFLMLTGRGHLWPRLRFKALTIGHQGRWETGPSRV